MSIWWSLWQFPSDCSCCSRRQVGSRVSEAGDDLKLLCRRVIETGFSTKGPVGVSVQECKMSSVNMIVFLRPALTVQRQEGGGIRYNFEAVARGIKIP